MSLMSVEKWQLHTVKSIYEMLITSFLTLIESFKTMSTWMNKQNIQVCKTSFWNILQSLQLKNHWWFLKNHKSWQMHLCDQNLLSNMFRTHPEIQLMKFIVIVQNAETRFQHFNILVNESKLSLLSEILRSNVKLSHSQQ